MHSLLADNVMAFYVNVEERISYSSHIEGAGLTPGQKQKRGHFEVLNSTSNVERLLHLKTHMLPAEQSG